MATTIEDNSGINEDENPFDVHDDDETDKSISYKRSRDDYEDDNEDNENTRRHPRKDSISSNNKGDDLRVVGAASTTTTTAITTKSDWNTSKKDTNSKRPRLASSDLDTKKRNQRLFGSLIGTLNKAKQETEHKSASQLKREELEKKLQEKLSKEKEELEAKVRQDNEERKEKFLAARKADDDKRSSIAIQHIRLQKQHISNWLKTDAHPPICYLPAKLNEENQQRLADSKRQAVVDSMKLSSNDIISDEKAEVEVDIPDRTNMTDPSVPVKDDTIIGNSIVEDIVNTDAAMMQQELGCDAPIGEDDQTMELGV